MPRPTAAAQAVEPLVPSLWRVVASDAGADAAAPGG